MKKLILVAALLVLSASAFDFKTYSAAIADEVNSK